MTGQNPTRYSQEDKPISVVDLYTIGIGPSSSHTVGPMRAAYRFAEALGADGFLDRTKTVRVTLHGSLALTGIGHATDKAVLLGLSGERASKIDPDNIPGLLASITLHHRLLLGGRVEITFQPDKDLIFDFKTLLPLHSNGMTFEAFGDDGQCLSQRQFYSVGGGFVVSDEQETDGYSTDHNIRLPHHFRSAEELLDICQQEGTDIAGIVRLNERAWRPEAETNAYLDAVYEAMMAAIDRALSADGCLPGGLEVPRRAKGLFDDLKARPEASLRDPLSAMDWVNLYALAVNEENAAGGRVVTAPTNGAAGVIPAVLKYYTTFLADQNDCQGAIRDFLMTAAAIGMLYKKRASISAAEVGCQGEVGVACSMAAGALAAVLGGTPQQAENAAEIGMEHNLGLTCDPIAGLVQIPCIERNTMGAIKAINAAKLALRGDGRHVVSLDSVIETMRQTGMDMQTKYKETSQGGLAVNIVEC